MVSNHLCKFSIILLCLFFSQLTYSQIDEKVVISDMVESCKISIPFLGSSGLNMEEIEQMDAFLDIKIVLLTITKQTNDYNYYYLEKSTFGGDVSYYLIRPEYYNNSSSEFREAIFVNSNPKKYMFYNAECFDKNNEN